MSDKLQLTEKTSVALEILREAGAPMFGPEIKEMDANDVLNPKGISAVMGSLFKKGLVDKAKGTYNYTNDEGKECSKELTQYSLTEEGKNAEYDLK